MPQISVSRVPQKPLARNTSSRIHFTAIRLEKHELFCIILYTNLDVSEYILKDQSISKKRIFKLFYGGGRREIFYFLFELFFFILNGSKFISHCQHKIICKFNYVFLQEDT